jgi:hypothetical protein
MNIDQQIQVLIDQAPEYGLAPTVVEAIAPAFRAIAGQLKHPQYYVLQTLNQNWLVTTLSHRTQSNLTKQVVYAFPTLAAAKTNPYASEDLQTVALSVPTVHILFQMLAMKPIDSIVFFETSNDLESGIEVSRQRIESLVQTQLQMTQPRSGPPTDIA